MKYKNLVFWILAILITLSSAIYQRLTGPTHPIRGKILVEDSIVKFKFARSHGKNSNHKVKVIAADPSITAELIYKRYKTADSLTIIPMTREGENLVGELPHQPPAGKLMYRVKVMKDARKISLTGDDFVIIRFTGVVPNWVLITHVLFMFLAMLLSNRAGLEAIPSSGHPQNYVWLTVIFLFIGGMILGPMVQNYAFGDYWTGFPFGTDLTDNKTAIAMLAWFVALFAGRKGRKARGWVILAAFILLAIYLIPHSMFGSELDYSQMPDAAQSLN